MVCLCCALQYYTIKEYPKINYYTLQARERKRKHPLERLQWSRARRECKRLTRDLLPPFPFLVPVLVVELLDPDEVGTPVELLDPVELEAPLVTVNYG